MLLGNKLFKNGAVICIAGYTGEGKSPMIKKIVEKANLKNRLVWDQQNEYDERSWTVFRKDFNVFRQSMTQARQSAIVFEEATSNIGSFSNLELNNIYTASEHNLNVVVMIFTSLAAMPVSLILNMHYLILFNTMDDVDSLSDNKYRKRFIPLLKLKRPVFVNVRQLVGAEQ